MLDKALSELMEAKKSSCWFCYAGCPVIVHIEGDRVLKVDGDREGAYNGFTCEKGRAGPEIHDHPTRLNHPLKRVGERGENRWQRITWDQALDEIATKLDQIRKNHGPEAVANSRGNWKPNYMFMTRFFNIFGSPNYSGPGNICFNNESAISTATFGGYVFPELGSKTRCLVIWAKNPATSTPHRWAHMLKLQNQGMKMIVIDPRPSPATQVADFWLQLRPGTDGALALAWIHTIINEGLYDKEFVERWTTGFDKLAERVSRYDAEWAAEITRVQAEQIRESARIYAKSKPACIMGGDKIDQLGRNASQAFRSICMLRSITGNLDVPGGDLLGGYGESLKVINETEIDFGEALPETQREKQLGADRFRLTSWKAYEIMAGHVKQNPCQVLDSPHDLCAAHQPTLLRTILTGKPYPVKALIVTANNILLQAQNTKLVYEALNKLDLLVVYDIFMTPTAMMADYVLPSTTWLERPLLEVEPIFNSIDAAERVVQPLYERKDDYYLWSELGKRLGQGEYWPWRSLEEVCDYRLKPLGYTLRGFVKAEHKWIPPEYKKYERYGFATPSGRVELYSRIFEKLGYDPLPNYEEPHQSFIRTPEIAKEYPLILAMKGTNREFIHSTYRQIEKLRKRHPDPIAQLNPQTAQKYGISEGDWIYIDTMLGRVKQKVTLHSEALPDVVYAEHGWWYPERTDAELLGLWESNLSVLIDEDPENCDEIYGSWPHGGLCKIHKAT
jgi:anaerobic selenocysteine-containing dehydrogenase